MTTIDASIAPRSARRLRTPAPAALRTAAAIPVDEAWRRWSDVLGGDSSRPLVISLLDEWQRYSGLDYREMLTSVLLGEDKIHEDWHHDDRTTPDGVVAFYDESNSWLPVLLWWHGTERGSNAPARCASGAARAFSLIGASRILDFGCGVGSTSVYLAESGFEVVASDVSAECVRFTDWRLRERGHRPHTMYLREHGIDGMPDASVDGIVTFDVLEHVHHDELAATIGQLARVLSPGGVVCFNQAFVDEEEVGHFAVRGEPLRLFHDLGFRLLHIPGLFWMAQKTTMTPGETARQRLSIEARIRGAGAVHRWDGPIGRRVAWRVVRYGVS